VPANTAAAVQPAGSTSCVGAIGSSLSLGRVGLDRLDRLGDREVASPQLRHHLGVVGCQLHRGRTDGDPSFGHEVGDDRGVPARGLFHGREAELAVADDPHVDDRASRLPGIASGHDHVGDHDVVDGLVGADLRLDQGVEELSRHHFLVADPDRHLGEEARLHEALPDDDVARIPDHFVAHRSEALAQRPRSGRGTTGREGLQQPHWLTQIDELVLGRVE
jgi:hypothetical protein